MNLSTPDWLGKHGGTIRAHASAHAWVVFFDGVSQYILRPHPAGGKFGCEVEQSNSGKRVPHTQTYASPENAIKGGLDALRTQLGW